MIGNSNFGGSVIKRESASKEEVVEKFKSDGWKVTGTIGGGKINYLQKSGINITVISGPRGTVVLPSGPIRGRLFGDKAVGLSSVSLIGLGASNDEEEDARTKGMSSQIT